MLLQRFIAPVLAVACLLLGLIAGGFALGIQEQETTTPETTDTLEWEMFSGNIAGYGAAAAGTGSGSVYAYYPETITVPGGAETASVFLYNKRTGKVYRYASCDDGACFDALPIQEGDVTANETPMP